MREARGHVDSKLRVLLMYSNLPGPIVPRIVSCFSHNVSTFTKLVTASPAACKCEEHEWQR